MGAWVGCTGVSRMPETDSCNKRDDDCNTIVDERADVSCWPELTADTQGGWPYSITCVHTGETIGNQPGGIISTRCPQGSPLRAVCEVQDTEGYTVRAEWTGTTAMGLTAIMPGSPVTMLCRAIEK